MFFNFDWDVNRDKNKTVITLSKLDIVPATYMLYSLRRKMGNWTSEEHFKLEWLGTGTNRTISIQVTIPAPKEPGQTRESFTEEWCSGYFSGIIETMKDKKDGELLSLCEKLA